MKRFVLVLLCSVLFSGGTTFAQCFGRSCGFSSFSSFSSFGGGGGGLRGRFQQMRLQRNFSRSLRSQVVVQNFVVPQVVQSFVVPQVQSFVVPQVSYLQSYAPSYVQSAPQYVEESDIPRVTNQLRQLQEMSQALQQLKAN